MERKSASGTMLTLLLISMVTLAVTVQSAQASSIVVDGDLSDWASIVPVATDIETGEFWDAVDLYVSKDLSNLYLALSLGKPKPSEWTQNSHFYMYAQDQPWYILVMGYVSHPPFIRYYNWETGEMVDEWDPPDVKVAYGLTAYEFSVPLTRFRDARGLTITAYLHSEMDFDVGDIVYDVGKSDHIVVDGDFADWEALNAQPANEIYITDDSSDLFIATKWYGLKPYYQSGRSSWGIWIFPDTDNNPETGFVSLSGSEFELIYSIGIWEHGTVETSGILYPWDPLIEWWNYEKAAYPTCSFDSIFEGKVSLSDLGIVAGTTIALRRVSLYRDYYDRIGSISYQIEETAATLDIDPDTLNLMSNGEWITAYIELPNAYDVRNIEIASIRLNSTIEIDPSAPTQLGDYDHDGIADLMVKFDRAAVVQWLGAMDCSQDTVKSYTIKLTITGTAVGVTFKGIDTIRILKN